MMKYAAILVTFFFSGSAAASIPIPVSKICPIGGEKFEYYETAAYTVFGQRPDGKPYGTWEFPDPLPICPSNKLVLFDDFTADEIVQLELIVRSPDFQQMNDTQTSYYRAYKLARELGRPLQQQRNLLHQAIWETDENDKRRSAYFENYLELAEELKADTVSLDQAWQEMSYVNAHRELARFDIAGQRLQKLMDAPIESGSGSDKDFDEKLRYFRSYSKKMMTVISKSDKSMEPKLLVPKRRSTSGY